MRWAALIKRVYEVDPLCCPQCGGTMAIVSFIERKDQADVIPRVYSLGAIPVSSNTAGYGMSTTVISPKR